MEKMKVTMRNVSYVILLVILDLVLFLILPLSVLAFEIKPATAPSCDDIKLTDLSDFDNDANNLWLYSIDTGNYIGFITSDEDSYIMAQVGDSICYHLDNDTRLSPKRTLESGAYSIVMDGPPYSDQCGGLETKYLKCKTTSAFKKEAIFSITTPEKIVSKEAVKSVLENQEISWLIRIIRWLWNFIF